MSERVPHVITAGVLVYAIAILASTLPGNDGAPGGVKHAVAGMLHYAGFEQEWKMFSPNPVVDGEVVARVTFEDGTKEEEHLIAGPKLGWGRYRHKAWRMYAENMLKTKAVWKPLAHYLRRAFRLRTGKHVAQLEIVLATRQILIPEAPWEEEVLYNLRTSPK